MDVLKGTMARLLVKSSNDSKASGLIKAINFSRARARDAYGETPTPRLDARFAATRKKLETMLQP